MRANDRNRAWIVVVLLFMFMMINFADKAVIGIAVVPIMQELELGPRQFGLVGSSFFLLFAVSQAKQTRSALESARMSPRSRRTERTCCAPLSLRATATG
jgi:hypothetical protein